jgi:epoxyqueuosine reductase QueG
LNFGNTCYLSENLEKNFKKQLEERQSYVNRLLKEMKEKEKEFEEYCRQVEIDREFSSISSFLTFNYKSFQTIATWWNRSSATKSG